jgi:SHS2 domain-containing protein
MRFSRKIGERPGTPLMYETFEHTADLGLRVRAANLPTLFSDAARGLFSMIVPDSDSVRPVEEASFSIEGTDSELLLFDWLNELLFTFETRRLLLVRFDVRLGDFGLRATAHGEAFDEERHQLDHEVKAITYHGLKLEKTGGEWLAEVIVDI